MSATATQPGRRPTRSTAKNAATVTVATSRVDGRLGRPATPNEPLWVRLAIFSSLSSFYLLVAWWLSYRHGLVFGDALSRTADARFVLSSRFPHLSAMGFVFTPLTTMVQLIPVAWMQHWPGLLAHGAAAWIISAPCMAGAAMQIRGLLRDRGTSWGWSYGMALCFALHPMIVVYAASGMSEAMFLFFIVMSARFLIRWLDSDDVHDLAFVGLTQALAYLVRYDALASATAAALLVLVVGYVSGRSRGRVADPRQSALMDAVIVLAPIATAFVLWAGVSWLIGGDAFAQFSSVYGNSEIVRVSGGSALSTPGQRLTFSVAQWLLLQPFVFVVIALAAVVSRLRRQSHMFAVVAVFAGVTAFQALTYTLGGTFGFLRFSIAVIPGTVCLVGLQRTRRGRMHARRPGPNAELDESLDLPMRIRVLATRRGATLALLPAFAVSWWGMSMPRFAPQEFAIPAIATPWLTSATVREQAAAQTRQFQSSYAVARYLDALHLPDGSVLSDTVSSFAVVASSHHPRAFVIPSDNDFVQALNDPVGHAITYVLAVPNTGRGVTDVVNRHYPTLYADGAGISYRVMDFPGDGDQQQSFRLYKVIRSTG